jgi:hypothetical protein
MSEDSADPVKYWLRNEQGRVWGPYTAAALERLRGQLTGKCEVALDGKKFRPSAEFPELTDVLAPRAAPRPPARDKPPPPPMRISPAIAAAFSIKDGVIVKEAAQQAAGEEASEGAPQPALAAPPRPSSPAGPPPSRPAASAPPRPPPAAARSPSAATPGAASRPVPASAPPPPEAELPQEVPPEGDLEVSSPARLYALAAATSASGLLRLKAESGRSLLLGFRRGVPEHLSSDDPDYSLARFLQRRGALTAEQVEIAEEYARENGMDLVSALFGLQLVPPAGAHQVIGEHAQFLLDRALLCFRGTFSFEKDAPPASGAFPLGQKWALLAGAVRRQEAPPLRARLGTRLLQPVVRSGGLGLGRIEDLGLNAQEARIFAGIDGTRTGEDLLQGGDPALTVRLLYLLSELGHLSFVGDEPRAASTATPAQGVPAAASATKQPPAPRAPSELPKIAPGHPPPSQRPSLEPRRPPPVIGQGAPGSKAAAPAAKPAPPAAPPPPTTTIATGPENETPQAQLKRLSALRDRIAKADHFEALGLTRKTNAAEVKRTFFSIAREVHPDTVTDPGQQELRALKEDLFARVNEAAQALSDDKRRKEYEDELAGNASQVDVARIFAAEEAFRKAEIMIKARKYQEGLDLIEEALALNDHEAEFYAWRGYAKFMLAKDRKPVYEDCVADCKRALKLVEKCLPAHLFLGHMAKVMGEIKAASAEYHRVLDLDQTNIEAQRELRLMGKK